MICKKTDPANDRLGFTLVEMLVAMAVTLLMMAALGRAFGFVGTKVRESRADTELANKLRDMTTRLSNEMKQCTVSLQPNVGGEDQLGYFLYYEGPSTNATSSIFRAATDTDGNLDLGDSKYGDFDDYLAFTAVATGNNWFTGKVPRYILEQKTAQLNGITYTQTADAFDPVVIRSKYAEIIYFASPEYAPASLPASPAYIDVDGDVDLGSGSAIENGLPDRLRIHRRVLLIRPDLNLTDGMLPIQSFDDDTADSTNPLVHFMRPDGWPSATSATVYTASATAADGWLYGMAGVHQQCDLSVRRVLDANGIPSGLAGGTMPTGRVAANSLSDLSKPHNRFAHVRVPNSVLFGGSANAPTSMPVLALNGPATVFSMVTSGTGSTRIAPPATPNAGPVVTPNSLSGFIRPEFVLGGDLAHIESSSDSWGLERVGEDLLTNNALAFDIQIFDPEVSVISSSNGLVVEPSDAGYRETVTEAISDIGTATTGFDTLITRERGGFVDLAYPVLSGGSLRGWQARRLDRRQTADNGAVATTAGFLISPFSGVISHTAADTSRTAYVASLYRSGRLLTLGTSIRLFQPAYDTYTSFYERDGFLQSFPTGGEGTLWSTTTTGADIGADGLDSNGTYGVDDEGERETLPPFRDRTEAVRITIRTENPAVRIIRQFSAEHRDRL
jgi:prepilin-type N-terminal cleavage/methylation domain-containing protein